MSDNPTEETIDKPSEETEEKPTANESEDESEMPPLEDIKYDDPKDETLKDKKIVIPEDKKEKKLDDGWLDVLDNGELKKFVLKEGLKGERRPERGCLVTIKVMTKLLDSQKPVESECFDPIDIVLGEYDVVQGLDLVIPLMDQNEVAKVHISPRFAYGDKGKGDEVPPNATLECEVHILSTQWLDEDTPLPIEDRTRLGNRKKERGNFWFQRQDYSTSISCYKNALKLIDATDEEMGEVDNEMKKHFDEKMKGKSSEEGEEGEEGSDAPKEETKVDPEKLQQLIELRSTAFNNLAMAQMKIEDFNGALKSVDSVLITQPNNVKALFRKGKIWAEKGELELAMESLKKAFSLEPDNKAIAQELAKYGNKRKKELVTERNLAKRMLQLDTKGQSKSKSGTISKTLSIWRIKNWRKWSVIGGAVTAALAMATAITYKFIQ